MKALVLKQVGQGLSYEDAGEPKAGAGEVVVELKAAALNRRDFWITQGLYPGIKCPVILGSDGAAVVAEVGEGVDEGMVGREVVVNPGYGWGDDQGVQAADFRILGMPDNGTFAERICVPVEQIFPKPEHLGLQQAAAVPLAGLTAYRALFSQGRLARGERVLITGIGGGVAGFALKMAVAAGARVAVTSSSEAKLEKAGAMGAEAGFDYTADGWEKKVIEGFGPVELTIDGSGGDGYGKLIDIAAAGGRIVNYGATRGVPHELELRKVFWKQLHLIGSTMGSPKDFRAMLGMVCEHCIEPCIDQVLPLSQGHAALECMRVSSQFGKLVLAISD